MDKTLDEFKKLNSTCWNEKYQPLTIDMTKDKYTGPYRLGLNSVFVPDSLKHRYSQLDFKLYKSIRTIIFVFLQEYTYNYKRWIHIIIRVFIQVYTYT